MLRCIEKELLNSPLVAAVGALSLPKSQQLPFPGHPNLTWVLFFLSGPGSLGELHSCYWSLFAPRTLRELEVPGIFVSPADLWTVSDAGQHKPVCLAWVQTNLEVYHRTHTALWGHFEVRLVGQVESLIDYLKHFSGTDNVLRSEKALVFHRRAIGTVCGRQVSDGWQNWWGISGWV